MIKILILLIILLMLLIFSFFKEKPVMQQITSQKQKISQINYLTSSIDLKIPIDYNFKTQKEFSFSSDIITYEQKEERNLLNFSQCHSFTEKPDALFNKFKKQSESNSKEKNNLYEMDCGIIQTSFPLSF